MATVKRLHLRQQFLQQGRGVALLPDHVERQSNVHISDGQQEDASWAMPTGGFSEPGDPDLALDETQCVSRSDAS